MTVSFLSITVYFLSINSIMESRDASAFKKVAEKPIAGMGPMTYRRPSARQHCRRCIRRKVRRRILAQTALVLSWLHFDMFDTRCHIKKISPPLPPIGLFQISPDLFERETVETGGDHFVKGVQTFSTPSKDPSPQAAAFQFKSLGQ